MPEIKHNFMGGKMNKDLDERLVPNGEYRDAMNIQVSTSDASDVGTIQNVLGNIEGCSYPYTANNYPTPMFNTTYMTNPIPSGSTTVGSISDEKNDTFYWLVSGPSLSLPQVLDQINNTQISGSLTNSLSAKDLIMRKTTIGCEPVLVDKYAVLANNPGNVLNDNIITIPTASLLEDVATGMTVTGVTSTPATTSNTVNIIGMSSVQDFTIPGVVWQTTTTFSPLPVTIFGGIGGAAVMAGCTVCTTSPTNFVHFTQSAWSGLPGTPAVGDVIEFLDHGTGVLLVPPGTTIASITQNVTFTNSAGLSYFGVDVTLSNAIIDQGTSLAPVKLNAAFTPNSSSTGSVAGGGFMDFGPSQTQGGAGGSVIGFNITISVPTTTNTNVVQLPLNSVWLDNITVGVPPSMTFEINGPPYTSLNTGCVASINYTTGIITLETSCGSGVPFIPPPSLGVGQDYMTFTDGNYVGTEISLDDNLDLSIGGPYAYLYFANDRVLNFTSNKIITGLNIVDDMLFWTDNWTEPKKININRSIEGTDAQGNIHTKLINNKLNPPINPNTGIVVSLDESHITVIKKSPKSALNITLITDRNDEVDYTGLMTVSDAANTTLSTFTSMSATQGRYDFSSFEVGDVFRTTIPSTPDGNPNFVLPWKVGTQVVLHEFDNQNNPPPTPFLDHKIKGKIVNWNQNNFDSSIGGVQMSIQIDSISEFPPGPSGGNTTLNYSIDTYFDNKKLFEFKFPRFSYRYKYEDGEYSTYAPFSEVGFASGNFVYSAKEGYNLGMTNVATSIMLEDYITQDIPKDVVEIDLLYKEDASPNVYVVDTIKSRDGAVLGSTNYWDRNSYEITADTIHAVLPSNQLLRPWDNVPKKALAQEVTGNRVVYGNYLQNYDLVVGNQEFYPEFKHSIVDQEFRNRKSIKSLREYQLGVVFTDKYGRETPVISNPSGTFKLDKTEAKAQNQLSVGLLGSTVPAGLEFYKFFIKETSGEYYNMAMDRYYDAEDGNYWLAFPSSDRNKIDIDTFLILKKGSDSDELVKDPARYKVLAIDNEAPDYIKTSRYNVGELKNDTGIGLFTPNSTADAPVQFRNYFHMNSVPWESGTARNMHKITDPLYVEFGLAGTDTVSNRYRVTEITKDDEAVAGDPSIPATTFFVHIDGEFGEDVNFIGDTGDSSPGEIKSGAIVRFYRYEVENKPQFDGRFFVKILRDEIFQNSVVNTVGNDAIWHSTASHKVYFMAKNHMHRHSSIDGGGFFGADCAAFGGLDPYQKLSNIGSQGSSAATASKWFLWETYFRRDLAPGYRLSDGSGNVDEKWLIDNHRRVSTDNFGPGVNNKLLNRYMDVPLQITTTNTEFGYEDVVFIDHCNTRGTHPSGSDADFRWDTSMNYNGIGGGVGLYDNGDGRGRIDLSFGAISPADLWHNELGFWDLAQRALYTPHHNFLNKIKAGNRFRWKEDPTQTVYTITSQIDELNIARFDNKQGYLFPKSAPTPIPTMGNNTAFPGLRSTPYGSPSNWNSRKRFYFEPADGSNYTVNSWAPASNSTAATAAAALGPIVGGRRIDKIKDAAGLITDLLAGATSTQNVVSVAATTADTLWDGTYGASTIEVGMVLTEVAGSAITPLLVTQVDYVTAFQIYAVYLVGYQGIDPNISVADDDKLVFEQPLMNGLSINSANNINDYTTSTVANAGIGAVGYTMEFVDTVDDDSLLSPNPAIWETEPKENADLDIYYEISDNNPINLNTSTIAHALPVNSIINIDGDKGIFSPFLSSDLLVANNSSTFGDRVLVSQSLCVDPVGCTEAGSPNFISPVEIGDEFHIIRPNGSGFSVKVNFIGMITNPPTGQEASEFGFEPFLYEANNKLNWHNCFSWGNGVESNRIRDSFNLPFISNGVKVSTTFEDKYKEEHRKYGLIYSGIYNSNSGVNNLNQFIQAEKITKEINPTYGSIQKLHSRSTADGDLITLCEDRVLRILANKDAVYNADGNTQLTATNNVLGQTIPFSGDFGISKNPESFAAESYRVYFADKVRGAIMRLSKDGLTPISDHGMKDWFRDNLKLSGHKLIGSYDDKKDEYNITLSNINKTVSFREDVKGWVSFKSFFPENGVSCANEYYTFVNGNLFKHHVEFDALGVLRPRNFFNNLYTPSSFSVLLNDAPGVVKSFKTINYEGSQSKIDQLLTYNTFDATGVITGTFNDSEYYNITPSVAAVAYNATQVPPTTFANLGWYVENIKTDKQQASVNEFIEKEGKWFNYLKGDTIVTNNIGGIVSGIDPDDFSFQGMGMPIGISWGTTPGCTNPVAINYNAAATIDDGSCISPVPGCTDITAINYNALANVDDGSCTIPGCTDNNPATNGGVASNYDPNATVDDGSCLYVVLGCTDNTACNFDPLANTDDGSCLTIWGCMDMTACNYNVTAVCDLGNCTYSGCNDILACNYDATAGCLDLGSCNYCADQAADNYNISCGCVYCQPITNLGQGAITPNTIEVTWNEPVGAPVTSYSFYTLDVTLPGQIAVVDTLTSSSLGMSGWGTGTITYTAGMLWSLNPNTDYMFTPLSVCANSNAVAPLPIIITTASSAPQLGCTDYNGSYTALGAAGMTPVNVYGIPTVWGACNYDSLATSDDGSCEYTSCAGCMDNTACNYDPLATVEDGSCYYTCNGCTDPTACNYDALATIDDGSCQLPDGCTDPTACNYDSTALCDDGSCNTVYGCTDMTACNYDAAATCDDGSCGYISGCTDPTACNYDALATCDDGSCAYVCSAPTYDPLVVPFYNFVLANANGGGNYQQQFDIDVISSGCGATFGYEVTYYSVTHSWAWVTPITIPSNSTFPLTTPSFNYNNSSNLQTNYVAIYPLQGNGNYRFKIRAVCDATSTTFSPWSTTSATITLPL